MFVCVQLETQFCGSKFARQTIHEQQEHFKIKSVLTFSSEFWYQNAEDSGSGSDEFLEILTITFGSKNLATALAAGQLAMALGARMNTLKDNISNISNIDRMLRPI